MGSRDLRTYTKGSPGETVRALTWQSHRSNPLENEVLRMVVSYYYCEMLSSEYNFRQCDLEQD